MPLHVTIRDSRPEDLPAIGAIYAHHVRTGLASFELEPPSQGEISARREAVVGLGLPWLVAEGVDGRVRGYAYAGRYHARPGYRWTLENSVYVEAGAAGQGIGGRLLGALLDRAEAAGCRQMVALIGDSGNAASIALHRRAGFRHVGTLTAVGFKFGRWVDVVMMQKPIGAGSTTLPEETLA